MNITQDTVVKSLKTLILLGGISLGALNVSAWSGPPGAPFGCQAGYPGCDGPIHVGLTTQTKTGGLHVDGSLWGGSLMVNGSAYVAGALGVATVPTSGTMFEVAGAIKATALTLSNSVGNTFALFANGTTPATIPLRITSQVQGANIEPIFETSGALQISSTVPGSPNRVRIVPQNGNVYFQNSNDAGSVNFTGPGGNPVAVTNFVSTNSNFSGNANVAQGLTTNTFRVTSGLTSPAQQTGRVLTSDDSGNASWSPAPAGTTITGGVCAVGQVVKSISATGVVTCGLTPGIRGGYNYGQTGPATSGCTQPWGVAINNFSNCSCPAGYTNVQATVTGGGEYGLHFCVGN